MLSKNEISLKPDNLTQCALARVWWGHELRSPMSFFPIQTGCYVGVDSARVEGGRRETLTAELLSEADGHKHVRGLGLSISLPLIIRAAVLGGLN